MAVWSQTAAGNAGFDINNPVIKHNYIHHCERGLYLHNMHNADINNNEFERCGYCAATLWVDNGTIADNTFWDIYPAPDAVPPGTPSYALTLIGTAYGFPIPSNNVNVTDNSFYYNNYADPNKPEYGVRVHTGCDASGAYHPTLNADGQGGQVSDAVDFEPWRCLS